MLAILLFRKSILHYKKLHKHNRFSLKLLLICLHLFFQFDTFPSKNGPIHYESGKTYMTFFSVGLQNSIHRLQIWKNTCIFYLYCGNSQFGRHSMYLTNELSVHLLKTWLTRKIAHHGALQKSHFSDCFSHVIRECARKAQHVTLASITKGSEASCLFT